ncbi:hypothetical protein [Demequina salsinemoris]|uniref:hypothetical protein n=1 Tax=Demequina salsinemoris TaxID=577470 RepID=UPI0007848427|nr:hypothetical protein [Demequina salsinemoris]
MKLHAPARIAAAALIALSMTGCSFAANITTSKQYSASDGVRVELEDATGLNLLIVSTAADEPAALIGSFENPGTDPIEVTVVLGDDATSFEVPAQGVTALGTTDGETEVVGTSTVDPGLIGTITVTTPGSGTTDVDVPVLDGTLAEYAPTLEAIG